VTSCVPQRSRISDGEERNLRERDHWGDPGVDGRIILEWIFRKLNVEVWIRLGWLRIEIGGEQL
jgi:hypothetical protein